MKFQKGVLSLATLALLAACSGHHHSGHVGDAAIAVSFLNDSHNGLGLAAMSGGALSVTGYTIEFQCASMSTPVVYKTTDMTKKPSIDPSLTGCSSHLTSITVLDSAGINSVTFDAPPSSSNDSTSTQTWPGGWDSFSYHLASGSGDLATQMSHPSAMGLALVYDFAISNGVQGTLSTATGTGGNAIAVTFDGAPLPLLDPTFFQADLDGDGIHLKGLYTDAYNYNPNGDPNFIAGSGIAHICGDHASLRVSAQADLLAGNTVRDMSDIPDAGIPSNDILIDGSSLHSNTLLLNCQGKQEIIYAAIGCYNPTLSLASYYYVSLLVAIPANSGAITGSENTIYNCH